MLAEEFSPKDYNPIVDISKGTTISFILNVIKKIPVHFKKALNNPNIIKPLNEDKLTQIFVQQLNFQLIKIGASISVQIHYSDLFSGAKGIPDFYFHKLEEDETSQALFVVESKRLPAPTSDRKKEYVIGETLKKNGVTECNGGIERFKIEKHGKGLSECGMLGFIESETFNHWLITINDWIEELSKSGAGWQSTETLSEMEKEIHYSYFNSLTIKTSGDKVKLHHIWIDIT